mmetsp:Transcript_5713/g.23488  ORF Transcript_5713/g.23488 Transcript_5713/m.23488 type:complete len:251 (+) Transcript_5713:823-1575(+)
MRSTTSLATPSNAAPRSRDSNAASNTRSSDKRSAGSRSRCIAHFKIKQRLRISRRSTSGGAPRTNAPSVRCPPWPSPCHPSCSTASCPSIASACLLYSSPADEKPHALAKSSMPRAAADVSAGGRPPGPVDGPVPPPPTTPGFEPASSEPSEPDVPPSAALSCRNDRNKSPLAGSHANPPPTTAFVSAADSCALTAGWSIDPLTGALASPAASKRMGSPAREPRGATRSMAAKITSADALVAGDALSATT